MRNIYYESGFKGFFKGNGNIKCNNYLSIFEAYFLIIFEFFALDLNSIIYIYLLFKQKIGANVIKIMPETACKFLTYDKIKEIVCYDL